MSSSATSLTDAEFADDMAMFLHVSVDNLNRLQEALQVFCNAAGSKLNWNKSVGFWVGEVEPIWKPNPNLRWIPKGEAYTYLGCQVGVDLKPELQIVPLLSKLRRKIIFWSSAKLSLAGRILVVNQVLLATMWYSCSAWIFSRSALTLVQRMVRNFLWSGSDRERIRAKVPWSIIILPKQFGGLGILDPIIQSKALLAKFIVRVWLPGQETWKQMCKWRLSLGAPSKGGPWVSTERWFLEEDLKLKGSNLTADRFFSSIFHAWMTVRQGMVKLSPTSVQQVQRQPLIWNSVYATDATQVLGKRSYLAWGKLDSGHARSYASWCEFLDLPFDLQRQYMENIRGGMIMYEALNNLFTLPYFQNIINFPDSCNWIGLFSPLSVLLAVVVLENETTSTWFDVDSDGRLRLSTFDALVWSYAGKSPVRILAKTNRGWIVDTFPSIVKKDWQLWVFLKKSLEELQWDPLDWGWRNLLVDGAPTLGFFQYSVKIG